MRITHRFKSKRFHHAQHAPDVKTNLVVIFKFFGYIPPTKDDSITQSILIQGISKTLLFQVNSANTKWQANEDDIYVDGFASSSYVDNQGWMWTWGGNYDGKTGNGMKSKNGNWADKDTVLVLQKSLFTTH